MTREKFKLVLEVDVDYDLGDMEIATYPYTQVRGLVDKDGKIILVTDAGKIVDFTFKEFINITNKTKR